MQGTGLTPYQSSLMETIDACGRTLLDTMNQVLDYSKIVSLEKQLRHLKKREDQSPNRQMSHRSAAHLDVFTETDVSVLAEEVVEGVTLGHQHSQQPKPSSYMVLPSDSQNDNAIASQPQVKVYLDFAHHDWVYNTAPGALRRIIMNIFSNAMKYTSEGHISLRMEVKESPENDHHQAQKPDLLIVTVSDTGKGISEDFLRGRLFVPFAQENSLASGSGLGLSIVRSLLKSLGGNINVQTQQGKGTTVKVTIPLSRSEPDPCASDVRSMSTLLREKESPMSDLSSIRRDFPGRKVAIWGMELDGVPTHPFWSTISHYLTHWYGLELVSPRSGTAVDILLAEELPSEADINDLYTCRPSILLIRNKGVGQDSISLNWLPATKLVNVVHCPIGPHKLGRLLRKCLEQPRSAPIVAESHSIPEAPKCPPINEKAVEVQNDKTESQRSPPVSAGSGTPTDTSESTTNKREARVLVVEDNMINLNLMLTFLKKRNMLTLDSALNGEEAVTAVKNEMQRYDIIFMGKKPISSH